MTFMRAFRLVLFPVLVVLTEALPARADVVETKEGTHLVGRVTKIADGKVYVTTEFAGEIVILQSHIIRLETDKSVAVRLVGGRRVDGRLSGGDGNVEVAAAAGPVSTSVNQIAASWPADEPEPTVVRAKRHWSYEASLDLTGKTGNHDQLGSDYGLRATRSGAKDSLILATNYSRQITDGVKSADQFKASGDYSDNYTDRYSWYARDEGGFDRIKDIGAYNLAASGVGYDFIKQIAQTLTGRVGLAYRFEDYTDRATPNIKSVGLDLEAHHVVHWNKSLLTSRLELVPTLETLSNVRVTHETDFDLPLSLSSWKLRVGVSNDYTSRPADDVRKLDTTYFGRLVLSWK